MRHDIEIRRHFRRDAPLADRGLWRWHMNTAEVVESEEPFLVGSFTGLKIEQQFEGTLIHYVYRMVFQRPADGEPWLTLQLEGSNAPGADETGDRFFLAGNDHEGHFIVTTMSEATSYEDFRHTALAHACSMLLGREIVDPRGVIGLLSRPKPPDLATSTLAHDGTGSGRSTCPLCRASKPWVCPACSAPGSRSRETGQECKSCEGRGTDDRTCPLCGGAGAIEIREIPCPRCLGDGIETCDVCLGRGRCDLCDGGCVEHDPDDVVSDELRRDGSALCFDCLGSGLCSGCGSSGSRTCSMCRGVGQGDPRFLWWDGLQANVETGDIENLTRDAVLGLVSLNPGNRSIVLEYMLDELERQGFPEQHLRRIERFGRKLCAVDRS